MRGISPLISAVLLIAVAFGLGAMISPWAFNLATDVTNQTSTSALQQVQCRSAAYDFDSSYATNGINYSIGSTDFIDAKIVNTGTISLYGFSMEVELTQGSSLSIKHLEINTSHQKTKPLPLKPGQSALLKANMTEDLTGVLTSVKVLNSVCPEKFVRQEL